MSSRTSTSEVVVGRVVLMTKATARKSTLRARPLHPDCQDAFNMLSAGDLAKLNHELDQVQADDIELSAAANMSC